MEALVCLRSRHLGRRPDEVALIAVKIAAIAALDHRISGPQSGAQCTPRSVGV